MDVFPPDTAAAVFRGLCDHSTAHRAAVIALEEKSPKDGNFLAVEWREKEKGAHWEVHRDRAETLERLASGELHLATLLSGLMFPVNLINMRLNAAG
jgi:hypothetical protein